MKIMLYGMPIFSLWIGFSYPAGLGLYWCYSSLFALGQTIVLNKIYTPEHVAELVQKDIAKQKKKGKPTLMEKMAEAQMILLRSESHFLTMRITMSLRRKQRRSLKTSREDVLTKPEREWLRNMATNMTIHRIDLLLTKLF